MEQIHNTYQYEALDKDKREIRILELLPGERSSPIKGKLSLHSLNDSPEYDAISYTWGDTDDISYIQIDNDANFQTPKNTEQALRDLRLEDQSRFLWIDAICINQGCIPERGHQIILMKNIYRDALVVRIWLDIIIDPQSPMYMKLASFTENTPVSELGEDHKFWGPLASISNHPYWTRAWVQQELYLARSIALHLREHYISIETLAIYENLIYQSYHDNIDTVLRHKAIPLGMTSPMDVLRKYGLNSDKENSLEIFKKSHDGVYDNVLQALTDFRSLCTRDARDKVYASLGLIRDQVDWEVEGLYKLPTDQIWFKIVLHILQKYYSLTFLIHVSSSPHLHPDLPSWMPNWTTTNGVMILSRKLGGLVEYQSRSNSTSVLLVSEDKAVLNVCGYCIGHIFKIFEEHTGSGLSDGIYFRVIREALLILADIRSKKEQGDRNFREISNHVADGEQPNDQSWNIADIDAVVECLTINFIFNKPDADSFLREIKRSINEHFLDIAIREGYRRASSLLSNQEKLAWTTLCIVYLVLPQEFIFVSEEGQVGATSACVLPGDEIWVLFRCPAPMLLRNQGDGHYTVQGPAYVANYMNEESMKGMPEVVEPGQQFGDYLIQDIKLQ